MGQKVNPIGFRLGGVYTWSSRWFSPKATYAQNLLEDHKIRKFLMTHLKSAGASKVVNVASSEVARLPAASLDFT